MLILNCENCGSGTADHVIDYGYGDLHYYCIDCQKKLGNSAVKLIEYLTKLSYQNSKQSEILHKVCAIFKELEKSSTEKLINQLKDWKIKNKEISSRVEIG